MLPQENLKLRTLCGVFWGIQGVVLLTVHKPPQSPPAYRPAFVLQAIDHSLTLGLRFKSSVIHMKKLLHEELAIYQKKKMKSLIIITLIAQI